jgi:hypothetical protein
LSVIDWEWLVTRSRVGDVAFTSIWA